MLVIDFDAVHALASVKSLIEPLRRAFSQTTVSPTRLHYDLNAEACYLGAVGGDSTERDASTLLLMPAWRPRGAIGIKIVTVFTGNAAHALPVVNAAYLLLSGQSGQSLAQIDGRALTLLRTAAVSALAADLLAPIDPAVLLMVGTGALSRYLIEGHCAVRQYRSVLVWGRNADKATAVARDMAARGLPVLAVGDLQTAAQTADVISCATLAEQPLIQGAWLKAQVHLDLVGSFTPAMREADDECMRGSVTVVDTRTALQESGDLCDPLARGVISEDSVGMLRDFVMHSAPAVPAATAMRQRTVFKSVGVALADLAAAEEVYQRHGQAP